jgi:hypothetical protein
MSNSGLNTELFVNRGELSEPIRWLGSAHRKPMVLRGTRQVGKSELIRRLASQQGLQLAEVDHVLQLGTRVVPVTGGKMRRSRYRLLKLPQKDRSHPGIV